MSAAASSRKEPQSASSYLHFHVSATATTTNSNGSAASSSHRHAPSNGGGGFGKINKRESCAACIYHRRKCGRDCPFAPYFPADQPDRYLNAQRLFGYTKILKTLKRSGADAMRSLIYQSEARAADPAGGCVRIIHELQRQLRDTELELQSVREQVAICRQASATDDALSDPAAIIQPADMVAVDAIYASQQPSIPAGGCGGEDLKWSSLCTR